MVYNFQMRYFVFLYRYDLLSVISGLAERPDDMIVVKIGPLQSGQAPVFPGRLFEWNEFYLDEVSKLDITSSDRVVLAADDLSSFSRLVEFLSSRAAPPSILALTSQGEPARFKKLANVSVVNIVELVKKSLSGEWSMINTRQKVHRLLKVLSGADRVLIMTQNDPDPDAIACGMATQALLGRDGEGAPICSLGEVARKENQAMVRLLRTGVRRISRKDVAGFDRVVMVDVQPPYFEEGLFGRVDAVMDHHPYPVEYDAAFKDVDVSYGATSTMLYEYLAAAGTPITQRLATALLYGIISDTMTLARDTSRRDFEAFTALWPIGNTHLLSSMSRPRLDPKELSYFVRAINNRREKGELVFMWLGEIEKEDIIPRLADFSLQIGEGSWTAVGGVYEGNIVVSMRNMSSSGLWAGDVATELFSRLGGAGGHQSMAKAVVPLEAFKKEFALSALGQVEEKLFNMINGALAKESHGG